MSNKTPAAKASKVTRIIAFIFGAIMLYGIWLIYQGSRVVASSAGQLLPEDNVHAFDGFSGGIEQLFGMAIAGVAGVLFFIFLIAFIVNKKRASKSSPIVSGKK